MASAAITIAMLCANTSWPIGAGCSGRCEKSKALEVPSDSLRKAIMLSRLLDLIEMRRAEYAEERSRILTTSNI
jgi:hypothetical protein